MLDTLLVIVVFGGGLLGVGVMLAAVLGVPRWGYAAALGLALWLVLALAYAMPFGWRAWVGDVALALVLAGSGAAFYRTRRARARLPVRSDTPGTLVIMALVGLLFAVPALVLPVPLDTDAQGFGYLALTAKLGGDLTTLAPFQPDIAYLYAPGFTTLTAYLSQRLGTPLHSTQFGAAAVLAVLLVWTLYDFGQVLGGAARARAHVAAALLGTGLVTAYMDAHYTTLLGLAFGAAFLLTVYQRVTDQSSARGCTVAALFLAAMVLAHPDTTIIVGLGFGAWLLLMPLAHPRPGVRVWLAVALGVPLLALVMVLPWLLSVRHLLGGEIASPFERDPAYWRIVLSVPPQMLYHGGVIVLVALVGAVIGVRRRRHEAVLALGWLLLVLEFAAFGVLETLMPGLVAPVLRYDYPFSIAWHGPVVPYVLLGGLAMAVVWRWLHAWRFWAWLPVWAQRGLPVLIAVLIVLGGVFNRQILAFSKGRVTFFGAFASHADVRAMTWLRENTPPDAVILNFPGPQEGDWVPVIAERRAIYYRPQPFFQRGTDPLADTPEQVALRAFWDDPADESGAALLAAADVDYVIVPQVVGNPASFAGHYRWRRPFTDTITDTMQSAVSDAGYLTPVFDADGAQVYAVAR